MKSVKKFKHIRHILIPCLSVAAVSSVVIPMSILNTRHCVFMDSSLYIEKFVGPEYEYIFSLGKKLEDGQYILVETKRNLLFDSTCWMEPVSKQPIIPEDTSFSVPMIFKSDKPEITFGRGSFDIIFTCKDSNDNVVWKDAIKSVRFESKESK